MYKSLCPTREQRFPHPDNSVHTDEMVRAYRHLLSLYYSTADVVVDLRRLRALLRQERTEKKKGGMVNK